MIAASAAAFALAAAGPSAFEPDRDFDTVAQCFAAFMTLSNVTTGINRADGASLVTDGERRDVQTYQGVQRLRPFMDRTITPASAQRFTRRAGDLGQLMNAAVAVAEGEKRRLAFEAILKVAADCHRRMDAWGAPPFNGLPPERGTADGGRR